MKKWFFILTALFVFQKWETITSCFYQNETPKGDGKILLYATSWCQYCQQAREFMQQNNLSYTEYDIEKSDEGNRKYRALGGSGVPLLVINGTVIRGYNPGEIRRLTAK